MMGALSESNESSVPVEDFLDPDDPVLFPRLSEVQLATVADESHRMTVEAGELLFRQSRQDTPFFVVDLSAEALRTLVVAPRRPRT
jgi:hypothetical protein